MEDDVLAEARSFFNLVREASNQGDVDLILAKILAAGSKHVSLVNAHLAKNGVRPGWDGHLDVAVREAMDALHLADDKFQKLKSLSLQLKVLVKERRLKKRTCSQCGTTVPLSARAFAYCAGCRHESVARQDRPRFCSVECQRAHWVAGHMHACLCQHIFPLCFTRTGKNQF